MARARLASRAYRAAQQMVERQVTVVTEKEDLKHSMRTLGKMIQKTAHSCLNSQA